MRLQDDMEILQGALREIAEALIQDADLKDLTIAPPASHVHLSASTPVPQKYEFNLFFFVFLTVWIFN